MTLEAAWDAVHVALPAGWRVGLTSRDTLTGGWAASAVGPHPGRGKVPESIRATGDDEPSALLDLAAALRVVPAPRGTAMDELRARLRLAHHP